MIREKFFVLSLPRSRSKWLSEFLSFAGRTCGHDLIVDCKSEKEFEIAVERYDGTCETGAMLGWKVLRTRWPNARIVTVHRPIIEVYRSFRAMGIEVSLDDLAIKEQLLLACAQSPGVLSVTFDQLESFEICGAIFAHCLDLGLEPDYWSEMSRRNIQIDMRARIEKLQRNALGLAAFRASVVASQNGAQSWGQH